MHSSFAIEGGHLVLHYEVTNHDAHDLYLLNRLYRTIPSWTMTPDVIYVELAPERGLVSLAKRLADLPAGVRVNAPVAPYVTPVRAGQRFAETVRIPLPAVEWRQYGNRPLPPEDQRTPRVYHSVQFTLGYFWRTPGGTEETRDVQGETVILPLWAPSQPPADHGVFQSPVVQLDIPVIEPAGTP